ncbi:MAG: hypothetical protein O7J95_16135 [Planctomycetota bacterium]|nr:hypothetical protein [Planctomycetota bacterium]
MRRVETPQSACLFGLARGDITPPVGIYHRMWGAARHDRSTGVHRPLTATALVFRPLDSRDEDDPSPGREQIVVALDHCLLWAREIEAITAAASETSGARPESILITFSHTHAAGLLGRERRSLPGGELIPPYLGELATRVGELVSAARGRLEETTVTYAAGRCALAAHRDYWDESAGQYVCGYDPQGPTDDTLVVARVTGDGGRLVATVVNYACHPTTLAWENTLISPDYPGALRELVEEASGAPCVFIQGASGELGPRDGYVGDVEVADRNGRQVGYATLEALESLPPPGTRFEYAGPVVSGATLGTWTHVPLEESARSRLAAWKLRRWEVPLRYREGLRGADDARRELERWKADERAARDRGDDAAAGEARARAERCTRELTRLDNLPPGDVFPYRVTLWRMGDAFWLGVEGEPYSLLQRSLRERFAGRPIVVAVLSGGSRPWYLPPAERYGKGTYQESVALLEEGSLERLIEEIAAAIEVMSAAPSGRNDRNEHLRG